MKDLAIVIVSCDRNAWIWPAWHHYFAKNFGFASPVYLISETTECKLDNVQSICINIPNVNLWTKKLREAIKLIPEQNLFIMMDDFLIKRDVTSIIMSGYDLFKQSGCDSIRFMPGPNVHCKERHTVLDIGWQTEVMELADDSEYKISWSPNIWKRSFLNRCIAVDESPWTNEIHGSQRVHKAYLLSVRLDSWYHGAVRRGQPTPEGKQLIEKI